MSRHRSVTNHRLDISDYQAARAMAKHTPTLLLWCLHRLGRRGGRSDKNDARLGALGRELETRGRRRTAAPGQKGLP